MAVFCGKDLALAADNSIKGAPVSQPSAQKAKSIPPANFVPNDDLSEAIKDKKKEVISGPGKNIPVKNAVTTPPASLLPGKGAGLNTSILHSFAADQSTGRASMSIPIAVPPGRKGIQPNISLNYSSGLGNGILGVGWNLELGCIERSLKKGVPAYDTSDSFMLNSGSQASELVGIGSSEYKPKIEGDFSKISFVDSSYWEVKDKAGTTYTFGYDSSSRSYSGSRVFRWHLNKVKDVFGNYLYITYTQDGNQCYPSKISYTSRNAIFRTSGSSLDINIQYYSVEFSYADRQDSQVNYRAGIKLETNKLLSAITVYADGERVRKYALNYEFNSQGIRSLLKSITQYGEDDSNYLPKVGFEYNSPDLGWESSSQSLPDEAQFGPFTYLADVNNDGNTDIMRHYYCGERTCYKRHTFLGNNDASWSETTSWYPPKDGSDENITFGWPDKTTRDNGVRLVDVNGDGWLDMVSHLHSDGGGCNGKKVYLNNKTDGWEKSSSWSDALPEEAYLIYNHHVDVEMEWRENMGVFFGDINSDGKVDIVRAKGSDRSSWINTGSSWEKQSGWAMPEGDLSSASTQFGDINGDGLLDFMILDSSTKKTYLNTGAGWAYDLSLSPSYGNFSDGSTELWDMNQDGLADIVIAKDGERKTYINTGYYSSHWQENSSLALPEGKFSDYSTRLTDVQGRGNPALLYNPSSEKRLHKNKAKHIDYLSKIDNGIGGNLEVEYQTSQQYDNTGDDDKSDLPYPIETVSQTTISDGQGNSYTTNYSYKDGLFDFTEREFRGFGYCKVTDAEGNYSESYFKQDSVYKGKPYKQETKDSSGNLYAKTENTWSKKELYSGVSFAYISQSDSYLYDGDSSYKQTRVTYEYDDYGNPAKVKSEGNVSESGDERTLTTEYSYNTSSWIVGLPKSTKLTDNSGSTVSQQWFYYDDAGSYDTSPSQGLLTKEEVRLYNSQDASEKKISSQYSYDSYGNLTKATNAKGYSTTTGYDSTLHSYPVKVTNAQGHTVTSEYDYKTGQATKTTDVNSQTTQYQYDSLGRLSAAIGPKDSDSSPGASYEYDLSAQPIKITKKTKSDYSGNYLYTYQFSDGLGRVIETKSPAQDESYQIVSGIVTYDQRGQVKEQYLPYLVSNTSSFNSPSYSGYHFSFDYDPVGRLTQTTNPDGTYSSTNYSDWTLTKTDENGNYHTYYNDAYGRVHKVEEHNDSETYTTTYTYDTQGNLTKVKDSKGNTNYIYYDSLGRKVKMDDPDMGVWSYEYDDLGNLTKQTDAKEQILEFEYDELNRLTKKKATSPEFKTLASYSYDDSSKENYKGRLSKITDQSGSTEFWYDRLGRETKSTKTIGSTSYSVEREYDALDRLTKLKYPDSNYLEYTYSTQGPTKVRNGYLDKDYVQEVTYNANGQITYIKYGNDVETNYTYDKKTLRLSNLKTEGSEGTLQNLSYEFYNNGNVKGITDSQYSYSQSFQYDDLSRLTYASGSYGSIEYSYDAIGNMLSNGSTSYSYNSDKPHALSSLSDGTSFEYDSNGNLKEKTTSESKTINYTYDYENRLTKVSPEGSDQSNSASVTLTLKPGWNFFALPVIPDSLEISSIFSSISSKYNQISRYNSEDEKFEHYVKNSDFNQFESLEYGRGYQVYISSLSSVSLTVSGKTPSEQITKTLKKGWNLIGCPSNDIISVKNALNNLERNSDYDSLKEYYTDSKKYIELGTGVNMSVGEAYFIHCLKDTSWKLSYNQDSSSATTNFTYDGDGGRVKKYVSGSGLTTTYVGSLYEVDSEDKAKKHIYLGSQRVLTVDDSQAHYCHSDHLGSSNVISDTDGKKEQRLEYYPYGKTYVSDGTKTTNYKYTGKEEDSSTGLYFYGARYYDPDLGRFIQPDTIVPNPYNPQDLNRYSYCNNNPINYTDPTGHSWKSFWKGVGDWFSGIGKSIIQNPGVFVAALVGGIAFGMMGAAFAHSFMLPSMSVGGVSIMEGALMTGVEFGIGGFGAGLAQGLASGQSSGNVLRSAGYGFAGGFLFGGVVGATYTAGWQNILHGVDSQRINNFYGQAKEALKTGKFQGYVDSATELLKMNATPPGAVLQGKSPLAIGARHSYLVAAKDAQVKAMGFGPAPGWQVAALKIPVPGMVRTESAAILATSKFNVLTWDLVKVTSVWGNMDKITMPVYELGEATRNCYGWTNAVLRESGLSPVDARDVW